MGVLGRTTTALLTAAVLLGGAQLAGQPDRSAPVAWPAPATESAPESAAESAVTLITGDKVTLSPDAKGMTIEPRRGREGIRFHRQSHDGHAYVIPSDARELVAQGRLDRRLFDVAGLVKLGYDDAGQGRVPLILTYGEGRARRALTAELAGAGVRPTRDLPSIGGAAVTVEKARADTGWEVLRSAARGTDLEKVWLDGKRQMLLDESVPQIGAPEMWEAGYTGKGSKVAVLDTGIDATHPDLAGAVIAARDFTGSAHGAQDRHGHGTHVASIIAGSGKASDGRYRGVAPDSELLIGKVLGDDGSGTDSEILAGMEWAAQAEGADIVNLSLGGWDSPELDPLEEAINELTEETGALFVVSAGNSGPRPRSIGSPANAAAALAVGAVDKQDQIWERSSRGPTAWDGQLKPDITAPGVRIVAARADGTVLHEPVGEHYTTASGTSMAAPHVAGAAAVLLQRRPGWKAQELKAALMAAAEPNPNLGAFDQGTGRVDLPAAIEQTLVSSPVSMGFGIQRWPHDDDQPVWRELAYRNLGAEQVELRLTAELAGPDGEPAPDGAVGLSAGTLAIPAGGTATVTVTADTNHAGPDGLYVGQVTATAGEDTVATPISVEKEVESYDLTLKTIGPDGEAMPTDNGYAANLRGAEYGEANLHDHDGPATARLPKGDYFLSTSFDIENASYLMMQPTLVLDQDMTITADARTTKPVSTTVENEDAMPVMVDVGYHRQRGGADDPGYQASVGGTHFDAVFTAQLGSPKPTNGLTGYVGSQWAKPAPQGGFDNSPYTYALFDTVPGRFFTGYHREVSNRDLATVQTTRHTQLPGQQADLIPFPPEFIYARGARFRYDLPSEATHYVEGGNVKWEIKLLLFSDNNTVGLLEQASRAYESGRRYEERWNAAVFTPSWTAPGEDAYANRVGDRLEVSIPLYSDADGHTGFSKTDTAETLLLRDGEQVARSDRDGYINAEVAPGDAEYQIRTTAGRSSVSSFSTRTTAAWTFRSSTASPDGEPLPLWAVRYTPRLDRHNLNHDRGSLATVPMTFEAPPGSDTGRISQATLEVSTDDGATWTKAKLIPHGKNTYSSPSSSGHASAKPS
jgi:subtilisin family serine protease